ncbi:MAG: alpha-mannosidase [Candidatus Dormibacteraeota bacterium]|nr:alpha-mannosidase [Candidatus Dormibacteraeota bacterium]
MAGHAHIDLAWLWPLEETQRKAQRSFHTAAGLLDRNREMTFTQSSAELYLLARELDPELFERIRGHVARGSWEPQGGMWVEPDLNMTSGESIARQLLHGQSWFERELGARHRVAWLPDCFGFTPALPQLLRLAGIDSFFTIKLTWSETNRFPHDIWWWEGLDGSRVLAHSFDGPIPDRPRGSGGYNGDVRPGPLATVWANFRGAPTLAESLYTVGYGDGGGGPTPEMVENQRELARFPVLPKTEFGRLDAYFDRLRAAVEARGAPVWVGELYLELHRGTLTTQGRTKWLHRRAERDLVAAEVAASLCRLLGTGAPAVDLREEWRLLLRNQFHDILPGTGIGEVYARTNPELERAVAGAARVIDMAMGSLAAMAPKGDRPGALLVNPDLSERPLRAVLGEAVWGAQQVAEGWALTHPRPLAGLEVAAVTVAGAGGVTASEDGLENDHLSVRLAPDGTLASVLDRRAGREALAGPGNQLWAYVDHPARWEAWDIDATYALEGEPLPRPESVAVVENGPHRAAVRLTRRFRDSEVVQTLRLWAGSARLDVLTEIDWHERRILLKARFPLAVRAESAAFETAFGVVRRPTHRNTSWDEARFEVAGHRFADLSEPGFGVALLNDGRHGHHAVGGELGLTLLRSPVYPDPEADQGRHRFTYSLLPHPGDLAASSVLAEAEDLNRPLLAAPCRAAGDYRVRPLAVTGMAAGLGALKPSEHGRGLVLRVYEPWGARGPIEVRTPARWEPRAELNLLEDEIGPPRSSLSPFQVLSLRLGS